MPEDKDQQQAAKGEENFRLIEILAETLLAKRNEAVEARAASGVERRWREDQKLFDGEDDEVTGSQSMLAYATGEAQVKDSQNPKRSTVVINITRSKCEIAEGRFSDILLPVDDRNWGLKVTPDPEIDKSLKDERPAASIETGQPLQVNGQPLPPNADPNQPGAEAEPLKISDVAKSDKEIAKDRMKKMEVEVDDQLTECGYNGECRKVVADAVRMGTGILKGPNVVKKLKKSWGQPEGNDYTLNMTEDFKPASKSVDPWSVFPDPYCGEDINRAAYVWEREEILPRELRKLVGVKGYFDAQIRKVLEEEPKRTTAAINKAGAYQVSQTAIEKGAAYEKWEYYGDLSAEDLASLGCDCTEAQIPSVSACVVFVNDRPVKVMLNPLDSGDMPYDFFQWTTVKGSPFGIGVPRAMQWQQRVLKSAWRAMMDNAGDSSGANLILGTGVIPDDGRWEITGKKIWRATGEIEDVRNAFNQFQIANNQEDLQNIIELALRFTDMETSLPMLFQGEKGEMPETLGATNIMVDSNNVALRTRVKRWDDQITDPHITRYYDWNMQYGEDSEIKGDYNVDVRGTSVLLEKDQHAQTIIEIVALKADPDFATLIDWQKAIKQFCAAKRLDILKTEDELKALKEQPQQPQPGQEQGADSIAVATIRAESTIQIEEMKQKAAIEELQFKHDAMVAELETKGKMAESDQQHEMGMKQIDYAMKMMELSEKSGI
ncbi:MAG: hypothetical protein KAV87_49890, partial [Desulfobacteraceae bacterium]|nr:hypothetical protein [Desulfobacteraceae bacterium]